MLSGNHASSAWCGQGRRAHGSTRVTASNGPYARSSSMVVEEAPAYQRHAPQPSGQEEGNQFSPPRRQPSWDTHSAPRRQEGHGGGTGGSSDRESYAPRRDQHRPYSDRGFGGRGGRGGRGQPSGSSPPAPPFKMVLKPISKFVQKPGSFLDSKQGTGLAVTWLGTSSGAPTLERNVSCTVVSMPGSAVLVDCGEGSHRQLPAAGVPLNQVRSIHVTHLHGDHCYGLGSVIRGIDLAKVEEAAATAGAATAAGRETGPAKPIVTHIWGPPGLVQLLQAQLVLTGAHLGLRTYFIVTEFVLMAEDAVPQAQPMVAGCDKLLVRRQAPRAISEIASLQGALNTVQPALDRIPQVWYPPRQPAPSMGLPSLGSTLQGGISDDHAESLYGRNFLATPGVFWVVQPTPLPGQDPKDVPEPKLHCLAAQLQHRVPCWGYVFQEVEPAQPDVPRRKVCILGDTINSAGIAPLAMGCDVISHEATFSKGMEDKCRVAQHSTGWMAGAFAEAVQAKQLVLTHFSARYTRLGGPEGRSSLSSQGGRRGGRNAGPFRERDVSFEEESAQQSQAIGHLVQEARSYYKGGPITAALDFETVHVPLRQPQKD